MARLWLSGETSKRRKPKALIQTVERQPLALPLQLALL